MPKKKERIDSYHSPLLFKFAKAYAKSKGLSVSGLINEMVKVAHDSMDEKQRKRLLGQK